MNNTWSIMDVIDSCTSYVLAVFLLAFSTLLDNAGAIMSIGGMVLLVLRLYVDWVKAKQAYKESRSSDD